MSQDKESALGSVGILSGVNQLISVFLSEKFQANVPERKYQRGALDALFNRKKTHLSTHVINGSMSSLDSGPVLELSSHCFELRLKSQNRLAQRIEECLEKLIEKSKTSHESVQQLVPVLSLLSYLKTVPSSDSKVLSVEEESQNYFPFQCVFRTRSFHPKNDNLISPIEDAFLMNVVGKPAPNPVERYNSIILEPLPDLHSLQRHNDVLFITNEAPGTGLKFIKPKNNLNSDTDFQIPPLDLISDKKGRKLRIPMAKTENKQVKLGKKEDKGALSLFSSYGDDIWDKIWEVEVPHRRTWEALGLSMFPEDKPYLTELGSNATHASWCLAMTNLKFVDSSIHIPELRPISKKKLLLDIQYLLIGVASNTFYFDLSEDCFKIAQGTCTDGLTPESLNIFCQRFMDVGLICRKLETMCVVDKNSKSSKGLIYSGFMNGINNYLRGYRSLMLKIVPNRSLLELYGVLATFLGQMEFLGTLCLGTDELPTGIQLLCHLFDRTLHVNTKDLYYVMISILRSTSEPYFRFLDSWVFHGSYMDDFCEFGLECQRRFLGARSRLFWTSAFSTSCLPLDLSICKEGNFISDIQKEVFICGKSLNLLKLCQPSHHLCVSHVERQPKIRLLVSSNEQAALKLECREYIDHANEIALGKTTSMKRLKEKEIEEKKVLLKVAHSRHKQNLERLRQERKSLMEEEIRKKRMIFEDLRKQVIEEKNRKEEAKRKKIEEDKIWAEITKQREAEAVRKEEQVKKSLQDHFKKMCLEAEKREERANWRRRRSELRDSRLKFWREENKKTVAALNALSESKSVSQTHTKRSDSSSWTSVHLKKDYLQNIQLVLKDNEGNIILEDVKNWSTFSRGVQEQMLSTEFYNLPKWMQDQLLKNMDQDPDLSFVNEKYVFETKPSLFIHPSTSKRPRPKSFFDSAEKRQESDSRKPVRGKNDSADIYISLGAALNKDDEDLMNANVTRRSSSKEIHTIDGRKRPTSSKTIEEILYPSRFSQHDPSAPTTPVSPTKTQFSLSQGPQVRPYASKFSEIFSRKIENASLMPSDMIQRVKNASEITTDAFSPLTLLMENSILIPLRAQIKVVNAALLDYLLVDAKLLDNFRALRNYLLFHDGEFAQIISYSLFSKLRESQSEVVNPATLQRIVENALMSSTFGSRDPLGNNVGFVLRDLDEKKDIFSQLKLGYRTEWPVNIILTSEVIDIYGEISQFLLQLKKAVWGLEQVYFAMKVLRGFESSEQVRKIHTMRHDMLHFVNVTQDYVKTMVLEVTWSEFEKDLEENVKSLDGLFDAHLKYLQKAKRRSLLHHSSRTIQAAIRNIFNVIANFFVHLTDAHWSISAGVAVHPKFALIEEDYAIFLDYSRFLFKVIQTVTTKYEQHHLHNLFLNLNFNNHYERIASKS